MSFAPRITERVLEALCPPSEFRDGIVGDLSEEYLDRRFADGPLAARLWYYRQAFANAPHLVGHGALRVTFGTWLRLAAYGFVAMVASRIAIFVVQAAIVMSLGVVPDSPGIVYLAWRDLVDAYPLMVPLLRGAAWIPSALAGYLIGRRHREAPLAAAGVSAIAASLIAIAFMWTSPGEWTRLAYVAFATNLAAWMLSMLVGGASAALTMRPSGQRYQVD